jgi:23S rRNA pseudouridine2605 synthase
MEEIRLNKFVASCTDLSRREADRLIQEGEVSVNGSITINPAVRVTDEHSVRLGRKVLSRRQTMVVAFHKPRGVVCSKNDERGRKTIYNILPYKHHHLKHVGRLDLDSEGLLIMTNDGDLAQRITHPSKKLEKEYLVTVDQHFDHKVLLQLVKGVHTSEGQAKAKFAQRVSSRRLSVVLESGMKRQIRLMLEALGLRVTKLSRLRIGSLTLGELPVGETEELPKEAVELLLTNPRKPGK